MFLIYPPQSGDEYLFTCRLYDVPKQSNGTFTFNIEGKAGNNLLMDSDESFIIKCSIRAGSKYLYYDASMIGGNSWVDSEQKNLIWLNSTDNLVPIDAGTLPACEYIEFKFYRYSLPENVKFIGITDISIVATRDGASDFDESQTIYK